MFNGVPHDVTRFVAKHPGGKEVLVKNNGKEISELFLEMQHSDNAKRILEKYRIR